MSNEPVEELSLSGPVTILVQIWRGSAMAQDRITGSTKEFAGKVEGAVGNVAGDTKAQADGLARQATGTAQDLYGQAKDMARDATDAATNYGKKAYEHSGGHVLARA